MPLLAALFLFFGLAGMGVPGTSGFPAELLILVSSITTHTGAGLAALFGLVGAGYFLAIYRRAFLGPGSNDVVATACDLRPRELILITLMGALILAAGVYPDAVLGLTRVASEAWVSRLLAGG